MREIFKGNKIKHTLMAFKCTETEIEKKTLFLIKRECRGHFNPTVT